MLLVAQRKLESIRVLDDVLERVKVIVVSPFPEKSSPLTQLSGRKPVLRRETPFSGSCSSSVDAGVGTDPLITTIPSYSSVTYTFTPTRLPESNPKFENLYQHRWTPR